MMSEFGSFEESEYSRFQPNYFGQPNNETDKMGEQPGPTNDMEEVYGGLNYHQFQPNADSPSQKYTENRQTHDQTLTRNTNFIQVGHKTRRKYLQARKGSNKETNDLTINVCTLMKSFCKEYETFQQIQERDAELINEFEKAKSNLQSIKKLLGSNRNEQDKNDIYYQEKQHNQSNHRMRRHFSELLLQPQTIAGIIRSRKMKFSNKIVFIKYLENIRRKTSQPEQLSKWKNRDV